MTIKDNIAELNMYKSNHTIQMTREILIMLQICHNKTGEINPKKIAHLIEAYVRKCRNNKKKTSSAKITKPT